MKLKPTRSASVLIIISIILIGCSNPFQSQNDDSKPTVQKPVFTPEPGEFEVDKNITIKTNTEGATIYYTIDGSTPNENSNKYDDPISVNEGTTNIKAIAYKEGMNPSEVASGEYTITYKQVAPPSFSPDGGTFSSDQSVEISTTTEDATIYYTLDETTPDNTSNEYTEPISICGDGTTKTIKAIAAKEDMEKSEIAETTITISYTTEEFWVTDYTKDYMSESDAWYKINAKKAIESNKCSIYVESGQNIDQSTIQEIANEFDNKIWNVIVNNFSNPTDIDNNGLIKILLLDIRDDYNPPNNSSYVGGLFFSLDLLSNEAVQSLGYPDYVKSNEAEILYVDVNPTDPTSINCRSTIVHEFQHLVSYGQNAVRENNSPMPIWIDEGFSTAAEAIYQNTDILKSREAWYDMDPLYSGSIDNIAKDVGKSIAYGYPLALWNIYPSNPYAVLNNYALSHLFFSWLRIQVGNNGIFKSIHDRNDNNVQAVVSVATEQLGDEVNTFEKLISRWLMANILGGYGKETGIESYKGKNSHNGPYMFNGAGTSIDIYPSGAVHFVNAGYDDWTPDGGGSEIGYQLGDVGEKTADYTAPFGTGDTDHEVMIVYNSENSGYTAGTSAELPNIYSNKATSLLSSSSQTEDNLKLNVSTDDSGNLPVSSFRKGSETNNNLPELNNSLKD